MFELRRNRAVAGVLVCAVAVLGLCLVPTGAATPTTAGDFKHFVPADKGLSPKWIASLYAKGAPDTYSGKDLAAIGMPVGGIGAGQVYLQGDGTLGCWMIFIRAGENSIDQGFTVLTRRAGKLDARRLSAQGFAKVSFRGEYPIGTVNYEDKDCPVQARMEAFTPLIPLNPEDSSLPATMFIVTLQNTSKEPVEVSVAGHLQNAVCLNSGADAIGFRQTKIAKGIRGFTSKPDWTRILHSARRWEAPTTQGAKRPDVLVADFEGDTYGDWKTTGTAFGTKPVAGREALAATRVGKGMVDTYVPSQDGPQGTLTSPELTITRPYMNFLLAGGAYKNTTCMNLLVDGKVVHTACGKNTEALEPRTWDLIDLGGKKARIEIIDKESGGWGHINVDQIVQSETPKAAEIEKLQDYGTMSLALEGAALPPDDAKKALAGVKELAGMVTSDQAACRLAQSQTAAMVAPFVTLAPGAKRTFFFTLAWHFPNSPEGQYYASRFADADAVVRYVLDNRARLEGNTRKWRDTFYDSTLPWWVLDRLNFPTDNLASTTCEWWKNGRFWAWEGCYCCAGTCTHVWNYEHALARLWPQVERVIRTIQDLGTGFQPSGLVGHRGEGSGYAADGQMGTVLKCYREHQMSPDYKFLEANWPKIKKVLEFAIAQDANDDGLIENSQPNTYDIPFEGPNTFVGSLYLAALRAGEEMATERGDTEFAKRCRKIFDSGSKLTSQKLFDGEYFIQLVDMKKFPNNQYADGCLADQLFGQGWAHQLGLGHIYPPEQVTKALESIWKYNWAPDVGPQIAAHPPERQFVNPGEAGLFICTWPKSMHMGGASVRYRDECWTGIEYQVAGNMIWDGMLEHGLAICRAVHDRQQPSAKRNPYNEVECGGHYARAMASWGVFTALAGYEYHGPKGHIGFAPRITPEDFRCAFTAAEGWGSFAQKRQGKTQTDTITVRYGKLTLSTVSFALAPGVAKPNVTVTLAGTTLKTISTVKDRRLTIELQTSRVALMPTITIAQDQALEVRIAD